MSFAVLSSEICDNTIRYFQKEVPVPFDSKGALAIAHFWDSGDLKIYLLKVNYSVPEKKRLIKM